MDVVGNEMLDLSVVDYPTIAWAHPNTKHIHFYEGQLIHNMHFCGDQFIKKKQKIIIWPKAQNILFLI